MNFKKFNFLQVQQNISLYFKGEFGSRETAGKIAEFNLWNYPIPAELININTCGASGNIISWNTLEEKGEAAKFYKVLPATCDAGAQLCCPLINTLKKRFTDMFLADIA